MTRFEPLTEENTAKAATGGLTFKQLTSILEGYGLSIANVVHDPSRVAYNTFYADYEHGIYRRLPLEGQRIDRAVRSLAGRCGTGIPANLRNKNWRAYFFEDVPVPMAIYDFQRRYKSIPPDEVFDTWLAIYKRISYSNGMWRADVLDYVFSCAPVAELPKADPDGLITLYRGMGTESEPAERAISWASHPCSALWFAYHSGYGMKIAVARVRPEDIVFFHPSFYNENEVILRPGTYSQLRYEDMIPASKDTLVQLAVPTIMEYIQFGRQAQRLGYQEERGLIRVHGLKHILRVLLLSLLYCYNSGDALTEQDKAILIYFAVFHDVGRAEGNEMEDEGHGDDSVRMIHSRKLGLKGLRLSKKDYHIADLIIRYHCRDDDVGAAAIAAECGLTRRDKARAQHLYDICKDMDDLDRIRFNGLDYRLLRTKYAKRLPLVAGAVLHEDVIGILKQAERG